MTPSRLARPRSPLRRRPRSKFSRSIFDRSHQSCWPDAMGHPASGPHFFVRGATAPRDGTFRNIASMHIGASDLRNSRPCRTLRAISRNWVCFAHFVSAPEWHIPAHFGGLGHRRLNATAEARKARRTNAEKKSGRESVRHLRCGTGDSPVLAAHPARASGAPSTGGSPVPQERLPDLLRVRPPRAPRLRGCISLRSIKHLHPEVNRAPVRRLARTTRCKSHENLRKTA